MEFLISVILRFLKSFYLKGGKEEFYFFRGVFVVGGGVWLKYSIIEWLSLFR